MKKTQKKEIRKIRGEVGKQSEEDAKGTDKTSPTKWQRTQRGALEEMEKEVSASEGGSQRVKQLNKRRTSGRDKTPGTEGSGEGEKTGETKLFLEAKKKLRNLILENPRNLNCDW